MMNQVAEPEAIPNLLQAERDWWHRGRDNAVVLVNTSNGHQWELKLTEEFQPKLQHWLVRTPWAPLAWWFRLDYQLKYSEIIETIQEVSKVPETAEAIKNKTQLVLTNTGKDATAMWLEEARYSIYDICTFYERDETGFYTAQTELRIQDKKNVGQSHYVPISSSFSEQL